MLYNWRGYNENAGQLLFTVPGVASSVRSTRVQAHATQLPLVVREKRCTVCGTIKPLADFHRNKNTTDGHVFQCKPCACTASRQWLAEHAAHVQEYKRRYYVANREMVKTKTAQYVIAHREKVRESRRRFRDANHERLSAIHRQRYRENPEPSKQRSRQRWQDKPDQVREQNRRWRAQHAAHVRATRQAWVAAHRERLRPQWLANAHRRNARKRSNGGSFTAAEWNAILERCGHRCVRCGVTGGRLTVDHVVPIALGGRNDAANLQPLCGSCNRRKGARTIDYRTVTHDFGGDA